MSKARTRMEKAMYRAFAGTVVLAAAIGLALAWSAAAHAAPLRIPGIQLGVNPAADPREVAGTLQILALLTVLSLAPAILLMMTSFTRIVIVLSFARSVVFYFNDRKWAKSRAWLWAFLALYIVNTILTWDGPRSLLPGIAMSMTTIALWTRDMRRTRLLYLTNSPFWFTYDILARSYSCMVIEAIAFVSYVVAVWRFDIKKQPQT